MAPGPRAVFAALILLATIPAHAETVHLGAMLSESAAVPPGRGDAFGEAEFAYHSDSRELDYFVTYEGLSLAKVEIHGPADPGQNAPVIIPFPQPQSPIQGVMILSRAQGRQLLAGKWYVEARGQAYVRAAIRGQIEKK